MEKICWANTENFDDAEFVIVGIPDESQSHALRKGHRRGSIKNTTNFKHPRFLR